MCNYGYAVNPEPEPPSYEAECYICGDEIAVWRDGNPEWGAVETEYGYAHEKCLADEAARQDH